MWTLNRREKNHFMVLTMCEAVGTRDSLVQFECVRCNKISDSVNDIVMFIPDLQLDVKGCRDVYASFDKYVEVERLEGDNKYHAEENGLQVGSSFILVNCKLGFPSNYSPASLSSFVAPVTYFCIRMRLYSCCAY